MTSKDQQIKNGIIYLMPVIIGNVLPLVTLPIFTRILSTEDYGVLALAQIYGSFVIGMASFGLPTIFERNFFEYKDLQKASVLLYSTLTFIALTFTLCAILTYIFKAFLAKWIIGSPFHGNLLFWVYCSTGIISLKNYYLTFYKNMENAKNFVKYTIDESLMGVILSFVMIVFMKIGVIGLVWGQLLASLTIFLYLSFKFHRSYPFSYNFIILQDSLRLGIPLLPRTLFTVAGNQSDKYMISLITTAGGVGVYSIGQKIANIVFTYMTAIQNVFFPRVYKKMFEQGERGGEEIGHYLTPFAYVSVAIALTIALFSEEIVSIATPLSYHGAINIVIILSLFYASLFFGKQPQLTFARKTHVTSVLAMVTTSLNIVVIIPLTATWGAIGAAWGVLLGGMVSGIIAFMVSQHYYTIVWEYKKILKIYGLLLLSSLLLMVLQYAGLSYPVRLVIKLLSLMWYVYLGIRLKIISHENYQIVRQFFQLRRSKSSEISY